MSNVSVNSTSNQIETKVPEGIKMPIKLPFKLGTLPLSQYAEFNALTSFVRKHVLETYPGIPLYLITNDDNGFYTTKSVVEFIESLGLVPIASDGNISEQCSKVLVGEETIVQLYYQKYQSGEHYTYSFYVTSHNETIVNAIREFVAKHTPKPVKKTVRQGCVYVLGESRGMPTLYHAPETINSPIIKTNYSSKNLAIHEDIFKHIKAKDPKGRIAIYQGPPGTGKTYLVRNLISRLHDVFVILVQPHQVRLLSDPSFVSVLMSTAAHGLPIIFVLEDADEILSPRHANNMSGISTLLNLGDGILGTILDTRIICTTNTPMESFDSAITRPGRLLHSLMVDKLSPQEASACAENLLKGHKHEFTTHVTLAEVYAHVREIQEKQLLKKFDSEKE